MNHYQLLNIKDFEFVGYKYEDKSLVSRTALQKRKKGLRVYYYLPNGKHFNYYSVPALQSKKEKDSYLAEFNYALQSGFVPKNGANELRKNSYDPKDGRFSIFFQKYFNEYAINERAKEDSALSTQKSISRRIIYYFEAIGIKSITEITDEHIKDWDKSLKMTKKLRGKGFIQPPTANGWRKTLRAFLNTAKEKGYTLQCKPDEMNIFHFGKGGEIDTSVDARKVIYPLALIEAVERCSFYVDLETTPDIRKIIRLWREIGLRTGEMETLSERNLVFETGYLKQIQIIKQPEIKFVPKNKRSFRDIHLTDASSDFLDSLVLKFTGVKRYGKQNKEMVEYPYLFVFWDEKKKIYLRDDNKMQQLFHQITAHAIKEFNLPYKDDYQLYDLRRSCNLYLKTILSYSVEEASKFLGHSPATNKKHYTLDENDLDINQAQINKALLLSSKADPAIAKMYSRQFASKDPLPSSNQPPPLQVQVELDSLPQMLSSITSVGFVIMKNESDDEEKKILSSS